MVRGKARHSFRHRHLPVDDKSIRLVPGYGVKPVARPCLVNGNPTDASVWFSSAELDSASSVANGSALLLFKRATPGCMPAGLAFQLPSA